MRLRTFVVLGAALGALYTASPARAQQRTTTTYRTTTAPSGEVVVVEQPTTYAEPGVAYAEPGMYAPPRRDPIRVRFGIDGTGGAMFRHGNDAGFGGLRGRIGLQLGDWFAIYYQATGLVGAFMHGNSGEDRALGMLFNTGMLEVTVFDMVQLGVGPSADIIWGCSEHGQSGTTCNNNGPYFGLDGRVAVAILPHMGGNRMGLTLSADVHPTWIDSDHIGLSVLGGIGFDVF
jgi:hypothetical protein